ncbi:unnamed protein product [Acanthosepion pharaonis]|uniref:Uncharacterized protein n=1 Tax=Acanthosepion pharaonis TaxID=158019 RepID=A0A812CY34_ACAPH|nr:unnamed protein product [Sepia pharaonis]
MHSVSIRSLFAAAAVLCAVDSVAAAAAAAGFYLPPTASVNASFLGNLFLGCGKRCGNIRPLFRHLPSFSETVWDFMRLVFCLYLFGSRCVSPTFNSSIFLYFPISNITVFIFFPIIMLFFFFTNYCLFFPFCFSHNLVPSILVCFLSFPLSVPLCFILLFFLTPPFLLFLQKFSFTSFFSFFYSHFFLSFFAVILSLSFSILILK